LSPAATIWIVWPIAGSVTCTLSPPAWASWVSVGSFEEEEEWVSDRIPVESVIFALQSSSPGAGPIGERRHTAPIVPTNTQENLFLVQYVLAANLVKMPPIRQSIRRPNPYTPV